MSMGKKLLSLLLCFCLIFGCAVFSVPASAHSSGVTSSYLYSNYSVDNYSDWFESLTVDAVALIASLYGGVIAADLVYRWNDYTSPVGSVVFSNLGPARYSSTFYPTGGNFLAQSCYDLCVDVSGIYTLSSTVAVGSGWYSTLVGSVVDLLGLGFVVYDSDSNVVASLDTSNDPALELSLNVHLTAGEHYTVRVDTSLLHLDTHSMPLGTHTFWSCDLLQADGGSSVSVPGLDDPYFELVNVESDGTLIYRYHGSVAFGNNSDPSTYVSEITSGVGNVYSCTASVVSDCLFSVYGWDKRQYSGGAYIYMAFPDLWTMHFPASGTYKFFLYSVLDAPASCHYQIKNHTSSVTSTLLSPYELWPDTVLRSCSEGGLVNFISQYGSARYHLIGYRNNIDVPSDYDGSLSLYLEVEPSVPLVTPVDDDPHVDMSSLQVFYDIDNGGYFNFDEYSYDPVTRQFVWSNTDGDSGNVTYTGNGQTQRIVDSTGTVYTFITYNNTFVIPDDGSGEDPAGPSPTPTPDLDPGDGDFDDGGFFAWLREQFSDFFEWLEDWIQENFDLTFTARGALDDTTVTGEADDRFSLLDLLGLILQALFALVRGLWSIVSSVFALVVNTLGGFFDLFNDDGGLLDFFGPGGDIWRYQ